jgi:hypothetical protein
LRALLWPLFARSSWDQPATEVADTTGEGAALASVLSVGLVSASHCVEEQDRSRRFSGICSLVRLDSNSQYGGVHDM